MGCSAECCETGVSGSAAQHSPVLCGHDLKEQLRTSQLHFGDLYPNRASTLTASNLMLEKKVLSIRGDWNAKVESQEIPEVTGKFGLGVQNEAGQRLTESFSKRTHWS